jgi:cation transport ATPase
MTTEQHNKYIGISFLVYGGFHLLWMLAMFLIMIVFFINVPTSPRNEFPPVAIFSIFFGFMLLFQLIFTLPAFIAGYAMLKRKEWARIAGIVGAITSAMSVPIGTAVCVYALWFLFSDKGKEFYESKPLLSGGYTGATLGSHNQPWYTEEARSKDIAQRIDPPDWRG